MRRSLYLLAPMLAGCGQMHVDITLDWSSILIGFALGFCAYWALDA